MLFDIMEYFRKGFAALRDLFYELLLVLYLPAKASRGNCGNEGSFSLMDGAEDLVGMVERVRLQVLFIQSFRLMRKNTGDVSVNDVLFDYVFVSFFAMQKNSNLFIVYA